MMTNDINSSNRASGGFFGAKDARNISGKPNTIAGKFWYTMLSDAGVVNL